MKKFITNLIPGRKKSSREVSPEESSLGDMMSFLETKVFPCSECGHFFQLEAPEPLSNCKCSQCGTVNFVPGKLGPFWLYKFIGDGGNGRVYKASCSLAPDQDFAVKILPRHLKGDQSASQQLLHEAELTAKFNSHPNSVTAVEYDTDGDTAYLATEWIEGFRLDHYIGDYSILEEESAVRLGLELVSIIEYIFSQGYLFRDLKPENIMINSDGAVILIDYGLCAQIGKARVEQRDEHLEGSPHYVPPERMTGEGEDIRSEIYSLGLILFFVLTGETLYSGGETQEIAEQHVHGGCTTFKSRLGRCSQDMIELLERMTHREKRRRVQSLKEVKSVLRYLNRRYEGPSSLDSTWTPSRVTGINLDDA